MGGRSREWVADPDIMVRVSGFLTPANNPMEVEADLLGAYKCGGCDLHGSGKCGACFGTGQNAHLNSADPHCSQCSGTGVCRICQGSGRAQATSTYDNPWPMPIGLRLTVSIMPTFIMLMIVVMGRPLHLGCSGPVMPR